MFKTDTWLRCSIEFDSLPVLSSSGIILYFALQSRCILTPTVTSILPFNPNLGDQMLSSISSDFVTSMLQDELLLLLSLGLKRNTACLIRAQLAPHMQQWLPHKYLFWLLGFCCRFFSELYYSHHKIEKLPHSLASDWLIWILQHKPCGFTVGESWWCKSF